MSAKNEVKKDTSNYPKLSSMKRGHVCEKRVQKSKCTNRHNFSK